MTLINCPECSKEISDAADFCPNCGLSFAKNKQEETARLKAAEQAASENTLDQQAAELIKKLNRKWLTIIAVIIVLVALGMLSNVMKTFRQKEMEARVTAQEQAGGATESQKAPGE